jgi:hypothetical protein
MFKLLLTILIASCIASPAMSQQESQAVLNAYRDGLFDIATDDVAQATTNFQYVVAYGTTAKYRLAGRVQLATISLDSGSYANAISHADSVLTSADATNPETYRWQVRAYQVKAAAQSLSGDATSANTTRQAGITHLEPLVSSDAIAPLYLAIANELAEIGDHTGAGNWYDTLFQQHSAFGTHGERRERHRMQALLKSGHSPGDQAYVDRAFELARQTETERGRASAWLLGEAY